MAREELNFFLQYSNQDKLKNLTSKIREMESIEIIIKPNQVTLMLPINDPVSQKPFYSGEILATQCYLEVNGVKGWAMVPDFNNELSENIAICDACFAQNIHLAEIEELLNQGKREYQSLIERDKKIATDTKVNFEIMN